MNFGLKILAEGDVAQVIVIAIGAGDHVAAALQRLVREGRFEDAWRTLVNDKLRGKGQTDQAVGHVKQAAEKGVRQVKESARKIVDKAVK